MSTIWLSDGEQPCFCMSFNNVLVGVMGDTSMGLLSSGGGCVTVWSAPSASQVFFTATRIFALIKNNGWGQLNVDLHQWTEVAQMRKTHLLCQLVMYHREVFPNNRLAHSCCLYSSGGDSFILFSLLWSHFQQHWSILLSRQEIELLFNLLCWHISLRVVVGIASTSAASTLPFYSAGEPDSARAADSARDSDPDSDNLAPEELDGWMMLSSEGGTGESWEWWWNINVKYDAY